MDEYLTPMEKIRLACESAKVAKSFTTREEGIGEDLSYNVIAWTGNLVTAIAQLQYNLIDAEDRLVRVLAAIKVMRLGFYADAITFVAEGYCAADHSQVNMAVPLRDQFVSNKSIRECLTVTHVELEVIKVLAMPYTYEVGRLVRFDDPLMYPEDQVTSDFVMSVQKVLSLEPDRQFTDDAFWRDSVAEEVNAWGFHVHHDMSDLNKDDE